MLINNMILVAASFVAGALPAACRAAEDGDADVSTSPGTRTFYMSMTPWAYEFSAKARAYTYERLAERTDFVTHHFDDGVPWPEALAGEPYDDNVLSDIDQRLSHIKPGQKVYLALSPLGFDRRSLALYWGERSNLPRPRGWKKKGFDDEDVIAAYLSYCRYMISRFQPDYMAFAVEVNATFDEGDADFRAFEVFLTRVRAALKSEYPELPLFVTFIVPGRDGEGKRRYKMARLMLPYTDYVAVSTYPYIEVAARGGGEADPDNLPRDWFSVMRDLAPDKPFAVAETGFIAENLDLNKYNVHVKSNPAYQAKYVNFLLEEANKLDADFVVYWCVRDYDQAWGLMSVLGLDELFKMWRDIGLYDGKGKRRKAADVWDNWYRKARR